MASVHLVNLVLRRQTRPAVPMGRNLVPTVAAVPDCAVKGIPILTLVRVGPSLQAVHPLKFRPGQLPRFALAALLPAPATLVALKLVLSKARKNATVPASALPNVAAGVHLLTTVITEPAPVLINPVEKDKSVPLPIPAAVVPHAPAQAENIGMIYAKPAVVRKADVKVTGDGVLKPTMAFV